MRQLGQLEKESNKMINAENSDLHSRILSKVGLPEAHSPISKDHRSALSISSQLVRATGGQELTTVARRMAKRTRVERQGGMRQRGKISGQIELHPSRNFNESANSTLDVEHSKNLIQKLSTIEVRREKRTKKKKERRR